ncbi:MAG: hypothetical protein APF80_00820 [Alphaproteobacteria bacterium BRH_c36]|nr:MAG: hypothetical protein APF80_00820 [Alphaproteobacteria bacterium BRH_c36]
MLQRFVPVLAMLVWVAASWCGPAQAAAPERWVRIAQHTIDVNAKEETIDLAAAQGSFVGFQLRARGGRVAIQQIVLKFQGDAKHESPAPFQLRSGERTRVFAREDTERFPEVLSVAYQNGVRSGRSAMLELWGLQTRDGRNAVRPEQQMPVPPPPPRVGQLELDASTSILIAAKTAGREVTSETLDVADGIAKFKRLKLATRANEAAIDRIRVVFGDGSKKEFAVNGRLQPNTSTPWFDIDGSKFIKNVGLELKEKTSLTAPARFELYGDPEENWIRSGGDGARFNDGWVLIGAQTAGFVGFDNDVITLADHDDGFSELRVNVSGRAITLNQLRIVYDNGEEDIVPVRSRIEAGDTYGPITLRSGQKVKEVLARYRSRVIEVANQDENSALVQVWAKR